MERLLYLRLIMAPLPFLILLGISCTHIGINEASDTHEWVPVCLEQVDSAAMPDTGQWELLCFTERIGVFRFEQGNYWVDSGFLRHSCDMPYFDVPIGGEIWFNTSLDSCITAIYQLHYESMSYDSFELQFEDFFKGVLDEK